MRYLKIFFKSVSVTFVDISEMVRGNKMYFEV